MFQKKYIAVLYDLYHVLDTNSRMSVFRRLKALGYLTSFTDAGRYYTLQEIPTFDSFGLWFYKAIGFSRAGTLKSTIVEIVNSSITGMTPKEMIHLLKVREPNTLHNTLHGLVKSNQLNRHTLERIHLYTNILQDKAQIQIEERRKKIQKGAQIFQPLSIETTIAVLVEALKAGEIIVPPSIIAARLAVHGLIVTADQVDRIFSHYGIQTGKKTMKRL